MSVQQPFPFPTLHAPAILPYATSIRRLDETLGFIPDPLPYQRISVLFLPVLESRAKMRAFYHRACRAHKRMKSSFKNWISSDAFSAASDNDPKTLNCSGLHPLHLHDLYCSALSNFVRIPPSSELLSLHYTGCRFGRVP